MSVFSVLTLWRKVVNPISLNLKTVPEVCFTQLNLSTSGRMSLCSEEQ